ncbi:MAG: DUF1116 domain-containing protein [Anaerolineae bacterium]
MTDIEKANRESVERMMDSHPILIGVGKARDVIPGRGDNENLLTHAGPPIGWDRMSGPMRGAVAGALIFEGRAKTYDEAEKLVEAGKVEFAPCHHYQSAGPMAGLIAPSMSVYIVEDKKFGRRAFSGLNEGYGKVLRYGAYDDEVIERLRWMDDVMAPILNEALQAAGGVDMRALMAEALHMGDECHNRNKAGSIVFTARLAPFIAKAAPNPETAAKVLKFMGDNALTVLNPVMAACKAMADAAHNIEGSTIVSALARNGTDFGIRISGLGDRWFTAPAPPVEGLYFPGFTEEDANPDLGDSTIMETVGIGGFAMAAAPAIVTFVGGTAKLAMDTTLEMYEITEAPHKYFTIPALEFQGSPTGIDIRKVVEKGITPRVNTGVAHKKAGIGQVGAGLVRPPMSMFEEAVVAFAEKYGY